MVKLATEVYGMNETAKRNWCPNNKLIPVHHSWLMNDSKKYSIVTPIDKQ